MKRDIIITKDGSHSVSIPEMNVTYHSTHGAIQESKHVFIEAGFYGSVRFKRPDPGAEPLRILEMGFGTGLNALLTLIEAEKNRIPVHYTSFELYPLNNDEIKILNYCEQLNRPGLQPVFEQLHTCGWDKDAATGNYFTLHKINDSLLHFTPFNKENALTPPFRGEEIYEPKNLTGGFNLVYFDAFAPAAQPELWTKEIFEKLYGMMKPGGILVTYCSKGDVRRTMQAAGFTVEKIPGPPGKREMVRAWKMASKE